MVKKISTENARQGPRGIHALAMLVGGLILAVIVWVIADMYFFQIAPDQKDFQAEKPANATQTGTTPTQHLDDPSKATPQQNGAAPPAKPKETVPASPTR